MPTDQARIEALERKVAALRTDLRLLAKKQNTLAELGALAYQVVVEGAELNVKQPPREVGVTDE